MAVEDNKYLIFLLEKEKYGIHVSQVKSIDRTMRMTYIPGLPRFIKGITNIRGKIIPIIDLKEKLSLRNLDDAVRPCIIIMDVQTDSGVQISGLIVDELSEILDIPSDCTEPVPKYGKMQTKQEYVSAIGKVKGEIIALLDIKNILSSDEIDSMANINPKV